jgi:hypothetical protein
MRPPTIRILGLMLAAAAGPIAMTTDASAKDPITYVGTWALDPANCQTGQESENAPLVLAKDRYDQHESHCAFKSINGSDGEWKISADCMVEGSATPYDFTLTVSGDTLTFTDSGGARDFLRCK